MTTTSAPWRERRLVAGLLVAAVAAVLGVHDGGDPERARDLDRAVRAAVVDQHDVVDVLARDLGVGLPEGELGVIRRQHDDDAFPEQHEARGLDIMNPP